MFGEGIGERDHHPLSATASQGRDEIAMRRVFIALRDVPVMTCGSAIASSARASAQRTSDFQSIPHTWTLPIDERRKITTLNLKNRMKQE
jgi:hypothetical protein